MSPEWSKVDDITLYPHPVARERAVANKALRAGTIVLSVPSLTTVLFPSEKGYRCDTCHRSTVELQKCGGCGSYWFCGSSCRQRSFTEHHGRLCGLLDRFLASGEYQNLPELDKVDSLLLSHLVSNVFSSGVTIPFGEDEGSPFATFMALLPGPASSVHAPPICAPGIQIPSNILDAMYRRFGNNNFALHSHLTSYAEGIYPLASRLFNHSCFPNAVPKYTLQEGRPPYMEVVLLQDIGPGEEIFIQYTDPALTQSRQQTFQSTYGFRCTCPSCQFLERIGPIPEPPHDPVLRSRLENQLQRFIFQNKGVARGLAYIHTKSFDDIPSQLYPVFQEKYLANISEIFSRTSHEGDSEKAIHAGLTQLAYYILIYPPNFPQIGLHLLEMAKTAWNAYVAPATERRSVPQDYWERARSYTLASQRILEIYGEEGDEGGPIEELAMLSRLIAEE